MGGLATNALKSAYEEYERHLKRWRKPWRDTYSNSLIHLYEAKLDVAKNRIADTNYDRVPRDQIFAGLRELELDIEKAIHETFVARMNILISLVSTTIAVVALFR